MKADETRVTAAERNRQHLEQVRAVHRRSAYERVSRKIERYEQVLHAAELGLAVISAERCQAELIGLHELRTTLWQEMVDAGQVAATADK